MNNKEKHYLFLEEELQAETDAFKQKLHTSAHHLLLEREELFVAKFIAFKNGEMILKFSLKAALPRQGEYLFCFTTPKELHNYRNWGERTYGDLLRAKGFGSEAIFIWASPISDEPDFCLAGFKGVDEEFKVHLDGKCGAILLLGPNVPPYEYIANLQKIVKNNFVEFPETDEAINCTKEPILLNSHTDVPGLIISQLGLSDSLVLMGPPGTGKTTKIAEICYQLCSRNKSVLVTALTNRALMEVAQKEFLQDMLHLGKIYKTKITTDEAAELPLLVPLKKPSVIPGAVVMSTYYISSGFAAEIVSGSAFDYVIMDEASQALSAMFMAARLLGRKRLFVGDVNQLPPVSQINIDRVKKMDYSRFINGLSEESKRINAPTYMMSDTRRLSARGAHYTGYFYYGKLNSCADTNLQMKPVGINPILDKILSEEGGPSLVLTDMPVGDKKPISGISLATAITGNLLSIDRRMKVAVLTFYVESAKALQRFIFKSIGNADGLIVDTVSRVQGLTTDVVIYVIPNTGYIWSLERNLFNVATSRARKHTIIIADKNICEGAERSDKDVKRFLRDLKEELSLYIPVSKGYDNTPIITLEESFK